MQFLDEFGIKPVSWESKIERIIVEHHFEFGNLLVEMSDKKKYVYISS